MHFPKVILLTLFDLPFSLAIRRAKSPACWAILPRITVSIHLKLLNKVLYINKIWLKGYLLWAGFPRLRGLSRLAIGSFSRFCLNWCWCFILFSPLSLFAIVDSSYFDDSDQKAVEAAGGSGQWCQIFSSDKIRWKCSFEIFLDCAYTVVWFPFCNL